ncbi:RsiV family protein [Waddlia chondrophila]|nr:RsiV family protein [Waddlia chondrophila]
MFCLFFLLICTGCSTDKERKSFGDLEEIKKDFISTILTESALEEGPFRMNYHLKTVLFSDDVVSLMGDLFVYAHLPHGWIHYEGKTYVKTNGSFKEITLEDLFPLDNQKEFLRIYCENSLKNKIELSYFQSSEPLHDRLDLEFLKTFVVDHESLILIFQPYTVGGFADGPFTIKIPFSELAGKWQAGNPLEKLLPIKNYLSSWNSDDWISDIQDSF